MSHTVLAVDDERNMLAVIRMTLEDSGYQVLTAESGEEALPHLQNPNLDVILSDLRMPGMGGEAFIRLCRRERADVPVIVMTAHGTIKSAVDSIHQGACDYLAKPFEPEELEIAVHNALRLRRVQRENEHLKTAVHQAAQGRHLIGDSAAMRALRRQIEEVAPYKSNVLISGESGSGKEVVAHALHEHSPRREGPWVAINCAAIPRDLLESELFGYVKGAYTGASQNRAGRIEQAHGGTLFLDEIGDMDLGLQSKLLRVLQEREFSPVGSDALRRVDARFIAATNRDLKNLIKTGQFREDLYYRLDVVQLAVPPLRARVEDIPELAHVFLHELSADIGKHAQGYSDAALHALKNYPWPGNVRELHNTVERSLLTCRGRLIELSDLPPSIASPSERQPAVPLPSPAPETLDYSVITDLDAWLEEQERQAILHALEQCNGVQAHAAKRLGINERSLWHRVKKLGVQINRVVA